MFLEGLERLLIALFPVAKTHSQLNRRLGASAKVPRPPFGLSWYAGCPSAIAGNAAKVAVRKCSTSTVQTLGNCVTVKQRYEISRLNEMNAPIGFVSYENIRDIFKHEDGRLSASGSILAGLGAGCMESLLAVTPSESIKTAMYVIYSFHPVWS